MEIGDARQDFGACWKRSSAPTGLPPILTHSRATPATPPSILQPGRYVVLATTVEQIQKILRLADAERIPVFPLWDVEYGWADIPLGADRSGLHLMNRIRWKLTRCRVRGRRTGRDHRTDRRGTEASEAFGSRCLRVPRDPRMLPGYILAWLWPPGCQVGITPSQNHRHGGRPPEREVARLGPVAVSPYCTTERRSPISWGCSSAGRGDGHSHQAGGQHLPETIVQGQGGWGSSATTDESAPERCARF